MDRAYMNSTALWMWAQQAFGPGSAVPWHIHSTFPGGLEGFYREGSRYWSRLDYVSEVQADALSSATLEEAGLRLEYALRLGWQVVTPECEQYPSELRNISDPPAVLYSKGAPLSELHGPKVALAGARKALPESMDAARAIAYQLATAGGVVVTGEAAGVDACAMEGVISAGGRGICVLAADLGSTYMAKTCHLRKQIVELGGTVVTEHFSQSGPVHGSFHIRNRMITGLCQRVVLVQAAEKSGTMIYARHAARQGRKLYVFPGPEGAEEFAGSRRLLEEGAEPIHSGGEVLGTDRGLDLAAPARAEKGPKARAGGLNYERAGGLAKEQTVGLSQEQAEGMTQEQAEGMTQEQAEGMTQEQAAGLSQEQAAGLSQEQAKVQKAVLERLRAGPLTADELADSLGMGAGEILRLLTVMELNGLISSAPGCRFERLGR